MGNDTEICTIILVSNEAYIKPTTKGNNMKIELIATYRNETDGLEALVMDGNDEYNYRVVFRDSDADETVFVRFKHTYIEAYKDIKEFLLDDFIHVESTAVSA